MRGLTPRERALLTTMAAPGFDTPVNDALDEEETLSVLVAQGRVRVRIDPVDGADLYTWSITDLGRLALCVCT